MESARRNRNCTLISRDVLRDPHGRLLVTTLDMMHRVLNIMDLCTRHDVFCAQNDEPYRLPSIKLHNEIQAPQ